MPVLSSQKLFFGQASLYTTIGMASAIVRNTANNYRLYERRFALLDLTEDSEFLELEGSRYENPETALIFEETTKEILEVVRHLSPKNRAIIILRYWYDLSYEEIATVLDYQNLNTLKSRLHRSLKALGDDIAIGEMV
jgi:RNA polymerase sigma factor (sigma-70 family)